MSLRKAISVCCFILLPAFLFSCSDNPVSTSRNSVPALDTSSFTYPFKDGSTWNYNRKYTAQNFRPDSVRRYFSDFPLNASGTTTIL